MRSAALLRRAGDLARSVARSRSSPAATSGRCRPPAARRGCSSSHDANESRPIYSPDGRTPRVRLRSHRRRRHLRADARDRRAAQLTFDDGLDRLDGWSRDGQWLYFSSTSRDIAGMNDLYRVRADGGTPMPVSADRYTSEFFAAPSPDGQRIAFSARGNSAGAVVAQGPLAPRRVRALAAARRRRRRATSSSTERGAKQLWPMWSADGKSLYFVSDRSGAQNIWTLPLGGAPRQVTHFTDGRVLWPTISYDGRTIVFERDFEIWKLDTASGRAAQVPITQARRAGGAGARARDADQRLPGPRALARRPQGGVRRARRDLGGVGARRRRRRRASRAALRARSRRSTGRPTAAASSTSRSATASAHLFLYDFTTSAETQLTSAAIGDSAPRVSPDGKSLAFVRDGKELRVLDLASKQERSLANGHSDAIEPRRWRGRPTAVGRLPRPQRQRRSATSSPCPPPAARAAPSARCRTATPTTSRGAPTAPTSSSTPASAPRRARRSASI